MSFAYSYIRFSTKKQGKEGRDSFRRQTELRNRWLLKTGHELSNIAFHDLGKSAFHSTNLMPTSALSKFLSLVESGQIEKGSFLVIEKLDRLTRAKLSTAYNLFQRIIEKGIKIQTLEPEKTYDETSLDNVFTLMEPLMSFQLANDESQKKSDRAKSFWDNQRKTGTINARKPAWIDKNGKLNIGAKAIQFIFDESIARIGQRQILQKLVANFPPIGNSKKWNLSYINKILSEITVTGRFQPMSTQNGVRIKINKEIPNHYPRVISDKIFKEVQLLRRRTKRVRGIVNSTNIFSGLLVCANDTSPYHLQTTKTQGIRKWLVSYFHTQKQQNSCRMMVPYHYFEKQVLLFITDTVGDLNETRKTTDTTELETELHNIELRLEEIEKEMITMENPIALLAKVANKLTTRKKQIEVEIEKQTIPIDELKLSLSQLLSVLNSGDEVARFKLKGLIGEVVNSIHIMPEKHNGKIFVLFQIEYKNGEIRQCGYFRDKVLYLSMVNNKTELTIDLTDNKSITGQFFPPLIESNKLTMNLGKSIAAKLANIPA